MDDFTKLKTKRAKIRFLTSALLNRIDAQFIASNSADLLDEYAVQLDAKEKTFAVLDAKIEGHIFEEKAFEMEVEESEIWREKFLSYKTKIGKAIKKISAMHQPSLPINAIRGCDIVTTPIATPTSNEASIFKIQNIRSLSDNEPTEKVVDIVVPDQLNILTHKSEKLTTNTNETPPMNSSQNDQITSSCEKPPSPHEVKSIIRQCQDCGVNFQYETQLVKHRLGVHRDKKPYKCRQCRFTTSFKSSLMAHLRLHTGEKPFRCGLCGERFKERIYLKKHSLSHRKPSVQKIGSERKCEFCEFTTTYHQAMVLHLRKHEVVTLTDPNNLNNVHMEEKPFVCPMCSKDFSKKANLKTHVRRVHHVVDFDLPRESTFKPFKCNVCFARFKFRASLFSHQMKEHCKWTTDFAPSESAQIESDVNESPGADIVKPDGVVALEDILISGQEMNSTSYSNMIKLNSSPNLRLAVVSPARHDFSSSGLEMVPKSIPKILEPLRCEECSEDFIDNYAFEKHCYKVHGDSEPYKCQICEHATSNSLLLFVHLNGHKNDSPQSVPQEINKISKTFHSPKPNLEMPCSTIELTTSTLNLPDTSKTNRQLNSLKTFKCELCLDRFTSKFNMLRHVRNLHRRSPKKRKHADRKFTSIQNESPTSQKEIQVVIQREGQADNADMTCGAGQTSPRKISQSPWFECNYCDRSFPRKSSLTLHTKAHIREKSRITMDQGSTSGFQVSQESISGIEVSQESISGIEVSQESKYEIEVSQESKYEIKVSQKSKNGFQMSQKRKSGFEVPKENASGFEESQKINYEHQVAIKSISESEVAALSVSRSEVIANRNSVSEITIKRISEPKLVFGTDESKVNCQAALEHANQTEAQAQIRCMASLGLIKTRFGDEGAKRGHTMET